jgi:hypothetical protein
MQGSRSCLAPRERLPALLEPHAFDETRRHTIHRVKVIQPRVSKQRQASDTEQCVEHVHHVARPVRDPPTVRVLRGETFISAAEYKKTQTKEEKRKRKQVRTWAERMKRVSAELSIQVSLFRMAMEERTQWL